MNKIVAVVGMAGSGKSIATSYLEEHGWNKIYFGGLIYDRMRQDGIEITPLSQKIYREKIRKEYGMGAVALLLKDEIRKSYLQGNTVLDGLYSWDEYLILRKEFGDALKLICVCCDKKIRYERVKNRVDRPFDEEEILDRDLSEITNLSKGGPIAFSDYYIFNNGNLSDYKKRLLEILDLIDKEGVK